ncbi:fungal-specific transcription factor domain-containing protein [Teratosphaeria destructans]|uniref:Fungal-specific transcription factor domain-containing protein n=1 Tax=Teratosphaeria destructans TaxID=418781 RepID=A0A9W7SL02_9PEZI|nr:fungal-specific transcription factor domain-containing protein [Teratosphaeria destructans]
MACQTCRRRKVRCDRGRPRCKNCMDKALDCRYHGERPLKRFSRDGPESDIARTRPTALHPRSETPSPPMQSPDSLPLPRQGHSQPDPARAVDLVDQILGGGPPSPPSHRSASVWMRTERGDEYTGPSSGISAISDQGLAWMKRKAGNCELLCTAVAQVRRTLLGHLRQPKCITPGLWDMHPFQTPIKGLPPCHVVQEYVDAYFDHVQVIYPILDKESFLHQLALYHEDVPAKSMSWRALLFAVLASGCRAAHSDETALAFRTSGSEAWSYFVVALSMEQSLVHVTTDLTAVQALAVMTVFAQGCSSPQRLEYTLCSTTVRVAYSLALHCAPADEWELFLEEKRARSRTFWVIYCLDKTLALRCGRPSMIDDAEISTPIPAPRPATTSSSNETSTFDFFLSLCQCSRICSKISRNLYSAFALNQSCRDLAKTARQLLADVQIWRNSLPPPTRVRRSSFSTETIEGLPKAQRLHLQMAYYYVTCAIYRRFTPLFCHGDEDENMVQEMLAGAAPISHIEAARSMILLTKHIDVESYTPGWLVFYMPMTALLTVFLNLLGNPREPSAPPDIALMEVVVGFFGRLEYMTSGEACFTEVAQFVRQARTIVHETARASALERRDSPVDLHLTGIHSLASVQSSQESQRNAAEGESLQTRETRHDFIPITPSLHPVAESSRQAQSQLPDDNHLFGATHIPRLQANYDPWLENWPPLEVWDETLLNT